MARSSCFLAKQLRCQGFERESRGARHGTRKIGAGASGRRTICARQAGGSVDDDARAIGHALRGVEHDALAGHEPAANLGVRLAAAAELDAT
jgi:hypothetical protein